MVWAEMMSMSAPTEYKKVGEYHRDNYDSACGYAQEIFDSDESIYYVDVLENGRALVGRDIFPKAYYEGDHIEKCGVCGREITVSARRHGDESKRACDECYEYRF